ncbi:MAG: hypothetical protein LW698_14620 [Planctomycetaceae bacterium]|jgi:hypothetical protein|nr:hypothetical protein [Planctomycetaceae bacterium]
MPRFAILEHTGAPDDPAGIHYDLLIESGAVCRTWRLAAVPRPGGPPVPAVELPAHRRAWLEHEAGEVSGGRGFARRIDAGRYESAPTTAVATGPGGTIDVALHGARVVGRLVLCRHDDGWTAALTGHAPQTPA